MKSTQVAITCIEYTIQKVVTNTALDMRLLLQQNGVHLKNVLNCVKPGVDVFRTSYQSFESIWYVRNYLRLRLAVFLETLHL